MQYFYDIHGWFTSKPLTGRSTEAIPPTLSETTDEEGIRANWTGTEWIELEYFHSENSSASLQDAKDALTKQATEKRWECEISGVTLPDGTRVGTTIEDQNRITSVVSNAELAGVLAVDFKSASGWVTLSIEQVKGIAVFIARHVQDCFSAERKHHEAIAQLTSLGEVQSYNIDLHWPKYNN